MPHGRPTQLKEFAQRLLAHEAELSKPSDTKNSAAFLVCEKLRERLGKLLGSGGYHALLSRSLMMAGTKVSCLGSLRVHEDGSLEGLAELEAGLTESEITEGEIVLVTQILELLVTFVGTDLTLSLLRDIWPEMDNLNF